MEKKKYTTVKYNGSNAHNLDRFDILEDAVKSAKDLHDPSWPAWQGVWVIESNSGKAVFDSNVK